MENLNKKMAVGAFWMVSMRISANFIGLISTTILVRFLIPEDFGLVAMAMPIIAFMELLTTFGFDWVLIQKKAVTEHHYHTAWTFNVIFRLSSAFVVALVSLPAARFYNEPKLTGILLILALNCAVQGFQNIGTVDFRKHFSFHKEFYLIFGRKLAGFLITIPIAIIYRSYWGLILGTLFSTIFWVIHGYLLHPFRPWFSLKEKRTLLNFSKWLMMNNLISFFNMRAVLLLVGKLTGAGTLGIYTLSSEIASLITFWLVAPINRAVFSGYSKESDDIIALRDSFKRVLRMIGTFILPLGAGLFFVTEDVVHVWLGSKWLATIPIIKILLLHGMLASFLSNIGYILIARGKPKVNTALSFLNMIILLPLLLLFTKKMGVQGAAWAFLTTCIITTPVYYFFLMREIKLNLFQIVSCLWRPFSGIGVMGASLYVIQKTIIFSPGNHFHIYRLLATILPGAIIYTITVLILWTLAHRPNGPEQMVFDIITGKFSLKQS